MATREIAYTPVGRNALVIGLICHIAALLAGMMTSYGGNLFFMAVYPLSWGLLAAGGYTESRHRGLATWTSQRFYLIAMVPLFPIAGPLAALWLIYGAPGKESHSGSFAGFIPAFLRLKGNSLIIFAVILLLFLAFIVIRSQDDPYFKRRTPRSASMPLFLNGFPPYPDAGIREGAPC